MEKLDKSAIIKQTSHPLPCGEKGTQIMLKLPKLGKFAILFIPLLAWPCEELFIKPYTALELLETGLFVPVFIATDPVLKQQYKDLLKTPISDEQKKEIEHLLNLADKMR